MGHSLITLGRVNDTDLFAWIVQEYGPLDLKPLISSSAHSEGSKTWRTGNTLPGQCWKKLLTTKKQLADLRSTFKEDILYAPLSIIIP